MGLLDIFRGKKQREEYVLVFQPEGKKGKIPVQVFPEFVSMEDVEEMLKESGEPGRYMLQKKIGGRWAGNAWDRDLVISGEGTEIPEEKLRKSRTSSDRIAELIEEDLTRGFRWLSLPNMIAQAFRKAQEDFKIDLGKSSEGEKIIRLKEGQDITDLIMEEYEKFRKKAEVFGYVKSSGTTGQTDKLPVKGEVPWQYVYVPELIDKIGDIVTKRAVLFGLVSPKEIKERERELAEMEMKEKKIYEPPEEKVIFKVPEIEKRLEEKRMKESEVMKESGEKRTSIKSEEGSIEKVKEIESGEKRMVEEKESKEIESEEIEEKSKKEEEE